MPTIQQIPIDIQWAYQLNSGTFYTTYPAAFAAAIALSAANSNAPVYIFASSFTVFGPGTGAAVSPSLPSVALDSPAPSWFVQLASAFASGTYTLSGTPTTTFNNTYTIAGQATVVAQTTGNTLAQQATIDAAAINANVSVNSLVFASAVGAVVTITAKAAGSAGNAITTTGTTSGGDTLIANQAQLSGGGAANVAYPQATAIVAAYALSQANANAGVTVGRGIVSLTAP